MVHMNNPTTDYPAKALKRLNGSAIQSDHQARKELENGLFDVLDNHPLWSNRQRAETISSMIANYVAAVASKIRPEDRT